MFSGDIFLLPTIIYSLQFFKINRLEMEGLENQATEYNLNQDSDDANQYNGFAQRSEQNNSNLNIEQQNSSISMSDSMVSSQTMGAEEELAQAAKQLSSFDELYELVTRFEEAAFSTKKRINSLNRDGQQSSVIPSTLKLCMQTLNKLIYADLKDNNYAEIAIELKEIEKNISSNMKKSNELNKTFGKFKGEFFAINEVIVNKDISQLKQSVVQAQFNKQSKLLDKLDDLESNMNFNSNGLINLKQEFINALELVQMRKNTEVKTEHQDAQDRVEKLEESHREIKEDQEQATIDIKKIVPQTKEQRSLYSQIQTQIQKTQRQEQKFATGFDQLPELENQIATKAKFCDDFVGKQSSTIELGALLGNTKTLDKFVDCLKLISKYIQKIAALEKEAEQIKLKLSEIKDMNENYQSTIQGEMKQEIDSIIEKIRDISSALDQDVLVQSQRLDTFEEKLLEIKIADADQFFLILNKEVLRCKGTLDSVESTKDMHKESSEEIQINFESGQFNTEELQQLRQNLKYLQKSQEVDLPKARKNIDQLELYVIKSLKNQLNEDNKKSQQLIAKVKKSYEELQKKYEKVSLTANDSFGMLQQFNDRFDTADMERSTEIEQLEERLQEEVEQIGGQKKSEGEEDDGDSLHQQKRSIIASINTLVNKFNENNKLIKESAKMDKQQTTESTLNDLIHKNQLIQTDCNNIIENIDTAKQFSQEIFDRLGNIINNQILQDLIKSYQQKHDLIEECESIKLKAEIQRNKVSVQIVKGIENVREIQKKLNMFNPLNNQTSNLKTDKDFLEDITNKIDKTTELKDNLEKALEQFNEYQDKIAQFVEPITELGSREVQMNPEIQKIKEDLAQVLEEMTHEDQNVLPPNFTDIQALQKVIKELVDDEFKKRLEDASGTLDKIDSHLGEYNELLGAGLKKNKFYSDLISKAVKRDSKDPDDQQLNDQLAELKLEQQIIDKDYNGLDLKLKDLKKKKQEAQKALLDIQKSPLTYSPAQIDNLQTNLEEQLEKLTQIDDKLKSLDEMVGIKVKDLDFNIKSSIDRKELTANIVELDTEVDKDLLNLKEMLEKLPQLLNHMRGTIEAMQEGTNKNNDYEEKKDEIEEQLEELEDLSQTLQKFDGDYQFFKDRKDGLKTGVKNIDQKQKVYEQLNEQKDEINNLLSDVIDCQEQLEDLKNDIGDCEIPTNIAKRKQELTKFNTKFDRIFKEHGNLKKTNKSGTTDAKTDQMINEVEEKLKDLGKDKQRMNVEILKELDQICPNSIDDYSTNHELIRKIRRYKENIDESNIKLKEIEDIQQEVVKKLTELDMENSLDLLSMKAQELRQRLQESHAHLKKISNSGEEMEGNTSNNEEEEFIFALKNEMPEVSENINTTLNLLKEIEKIVTEVKQTLNTEKMMDLKDKVNIAQENVEESENLVSNLEKEILEWNAQKKLAKRDQELEEIQILCSDYIDDLSQEKQNTEIELEKNIEKQDENKDQDMVDKDGNKVDIMKDLVKLEGQMNSYLSEIAIMLNDIQQTENQRAQCFDDFSHDLPSVVLEQRKKRKIENEKNKNSYKALKRPAMIGKKSSVLQPAGHDGHNHEENDVDHYKMITINCKFKKTIKGMLKELKNINNRRKDLEDRYQQMRKEVFKIKQIKLYKPVAGDVVDEMFAGYLNKAKLTIEVQRIAANNYMFGTRKILAKIINGRLVIRVGGGYMNAEEFIDQYGRIEMMKMMKKEQMAKEVNEDLNRQTLPKSNKTRRDTVFVQERKSEMNMKLGNEIKNMMKKQLENITPYQGHQTMNDGTLQGKLRQSYNPMNKSYKPKVDSINAQRQSVDNNELMAALKQTQGYKTVNNSSSVSSIQSPDPFAKKMSSQISATPGRLGLTPLGMTRKTKGQASKSPQRNLKLGENTLQSSVSMSMLNTTKNSKIGAGTGGRRGTMFVPNLSIPGQKKDPNNPDKSTKITPRRTEGTKSGLK